MLAQILKLPRFLYLVLKSRISIPAEWSAAQQNASMTKSQHSSLLTFAEGMTTDFRSSVSRNSRFETKRYTAQQQAVLALINDGLRLIDEQARTPGGIQAVGSAAS